MSNSTPLPESQGDSSGMTYEDITGSFHIRKTWHKGEWYYSIIDMIGELLEIDYKRAQSYWSTLKQRLKQEGNETITNCDKLKLQAADGKMRLTDVVNTEQALRLIQSIPSPKAEPMKLWLAGVGAERLEETEDPELGLYRSLDNAVQKYRTEGRSNSWIEARINGIVTRKQFVDALKAAVMDAVPQHVRQRYRTPLQRLMGSYH